MALPVDYEKPYGKFEYKGHQDRTSYYNKLDKAQNSPLNRETNATYVSPQCAMNIFLPDAYHENVSVKNNEIYRMIELSLPTHIQSQIYPEDIIVKRSPEDKYASMRV